MNIKYYLQSYRFISKRCNNCPNVKEKIIDCKYNCFLSKTIPYSYKELFSIKISDAYIDVIRYE